MTETATATTTETTPAASTGDGGSAGDNDNTTALTGADDGDTTQNDGETGDNKTPDNAADGSADDKTSSNTDSESDGDDQNDQQSDQPTEYEQFTLPEGMEMTEEAQAEFSEVLTEIEKETGKGLSQETAQKFVDMGANLVQQGAEQAMQYAAEYHEKQTNEWIETFQNDAEIGGDEETQKKNLAVAKTVAKAVGGDALIEALEATGAGNHPEIIRAFFKLSGVVGEDGTVITANQGGGTKTLASTLYPNQNANS